MGQNDDLIHLFVLLFIQALDEHFIALQTFHYVLSFDWNCYCNLSGIIIVI
jgi:hypothetical protein